MKRKQNAVASNALIYNISYTRSINVHAPQMNWEPVSEPQYCNNTRFWLQRLKMSAQQQESESEEPVHPMDEMTLEQADLHVEQYRRQLKMDREKVCDFNSLGLLL